MMKRIISLITIVFALAGASLGAYVWHWEHRPHVLEIYCFALDKSGASAGNLAVFIRTPDGHTVLVDGGKSASVVTALTSVMPFYRRTIDTIISTNPDDSHVTGLTDVVGRYHIGQMIEAATAVDATSSAYVAFEDAISGAKIPRTEVSAGNIIDFGDPSLSVSILFPTASTTPDGFAFSKTNIPVLAFLIRYGSTEILFGGDISKKEQEYLAGQMSSSAADYSNTLLILPHGENVDATDESFFATLNPRIVVVSKKPTAPAGAGKKAEKAQKSATSVKTSKLPKIPFSISVVPGLSIINLATDGDIEFISDGASFIEKRLK
jgi:beta-lactamase superfamily II metal-dependent hydrolase